MRPGIAHPCHSRTGLPGRPAGQLGPGADPASPPATPILSVRAARRKSSSSQTTRGIRSAGSADEIWNRAAQAADLPPGTTPHDLRHHYASLLIAKGASVKAVQTMLRHKTANETLNTYAHLWPEDNSLVRRAVDSELSSMVGLGSTDPTADTADIRLRRTLT